MIKSASHKRSRQARRWHVSLACRLMLCGLALTPVWAQAPAAVAQPTPAIPEPAEPQAPASPTGTPQAPAAEVGEQPLSPPAQPSEAEATAAHASEPQMPSAQTIDPQVPSAEVTQHPLPPDAQPSDSQIPVAPISESQAPDPKTSDAETPAALLEEPQAPPASVSEPSVSEPQPPTGPPTELQTPAASADAAAPDIYLLEAGDRLKISFYGRQDLTAEYRVSDQGKVRIPTLGAIDATGRTSPQLEEAVGEALERLLQRPGNVTVDVIERRPVFVTGLVAKPGAYRFSAGMTVIHATALAGGTSAIASWLPTEALREDSHARASQEELKHLLANQARLIAEREGGEVISMPPRLIELAGPDRAAEYIHDEREVLNRQREILARQQASFNTAIGEAKTEVAAYEKELAKIQEQRTIRESSLTTLETLSKKGLTTQQRLMDSQILLASADRDAQYAIANISRSRQSLDRAERDLAMLSLERKMAIEKELQVIDEKIAKAQVTIEGAGKVIGHISGMPSQLLTQDREPQFGFEIMRKGGDGELHAIAATETTKMQPGDVLRVSAARAKS